jgi:hypothetical protein
LCTSYIQRLLLAHGWDTSSAHKSSIGSCPKQSLPPSVIAKLHGTAGPSEYTKEHAHNFFKLLSVSRIVSSLVNCFMPTLLAAPNWLCSHHPLPSFLLSPLRSTTSASRMLLNISVILKNGPSIFGALKKEVPMFQPLNPFLTSPPLVLHPLSLLASMCAPPMPMNFASAVLLPATPSLLEVVQLPTAPRPNLLPPPASPKPLLINNWLTLDQGRVSNPQLNGLCLLDSLDSRMTLVIGVYVFLVRMTPSRQN